eukprot:12248-Heterococcus_DN1.PRE.6
MRFSCALQPLSPGSLRPPTCADAAAARLAWHVAVLQRVVLHALSRSTYIHLSRVFRSICSMTIAGDITTSFAYSWHCSSK